MLKLFQSIFHQGADKLGTYPEDLIERAIDHVVAQVDTLPPPASHCALPR